MVEGCVGGRGAGCGQAAVRGCRFRCRWRLVQGFIARFAACSAWGWGLSGVCMAVMPLAWQLQKQIKLSGSAFGLARGWMPGKPLRGGPLHPLRQKGAASPQIQWGNIPAPPGQGDKAATQGLQVENILFIQCSRRWAVPRSTVLVEREKRAPAWALLVGA